MWTTSNRSESNFRRRDGANMSHMRRTLSLAVILLACSHLVAEEAAGWPRLDPEQWESMTPMRMSRLLETHSVSARHEHGATALMVASEANDNPELVQVLIDAGANVNALGSLGRSALMLAVWLNNNPEVPRALVAAGADPALENGDGKTAWDLIEENEALKGTDVYWELNDLRFQ